MSNKIKMNKVIGFLIMMIAVLSLTNGNALTFAFFSLLGLTLILDDNHD